MDIATRLTTFALAAALAAAQAEGRVYGTNVTAVGECVGGRGAVSNVYATVFAGDWAARDGRGYDRAVAAGTKAAAYSTNVVRSVAVGAGALYGATDIRDCVAVGFGAGRGWHGRTNCVDVGGAFLADQGAARVARDALAIGAAAGRAAELRYDPATGVVAVYTNGAPAGVLAVEPLPERGQ